MGAINSTARLSRSRPEVHGSMGVWNRSSGMFHIRPLADIMTLTMSPQNNIKTQAKFHATGGTEKVVKAFLNDPVEKVRSKAVYAISSSIRNYEPAFKNTLELLPKELLGEEELHHEEMEGIDRLIQRMREEAKNPR